MIQTTQLTTDQLLERASNKLEAKLFFAHKSLQEIELEIEGVISSKISNDILRGNYQAQFNEVQTLMYLFDIIEKKIDKKAYVLNKLPEFLMHDLDGKIITSVIGSADVTKEWNEYLGNCVA